jgi:hypothetical protein
MKKLISLLSILFLLTLFVMPKNAEADRGSGGHGGYSGQGGYSGYGRYGGFFPGLIISGALAWDLWPYYYPPYYYYPPPPNYYYPPPAEGNQVPPSASQGAGGRMFIYPRQGQSEENQAKDFDKCHNWAVGQTGFDPSKPPVGAPDAQTIQKSSDYFRAISACLDAHGYTVR